MAPDKDTGTPVMDTKETKPGTTPINPGNIPVLTVQLLDAINRNLGTIIAQNERLLELLEDKNG